MGSVIIIDVSSRRSIGCAISAASNLVSTSWFRIFIPNQAVAMINYILLVSRQGWCTYTLEYIHEPLVYVLPNSESPPCEMVHDDAPESQGQDCERRHAARPCSAASDERELRRKGMARGQGLVAQKLRRGGGSETLPTVFRGMGEWIAAWIIPLPSVRLRRRPAHNVVRAYEQQAWRDVSEWA